MHRFSAKLNHQRGGSFDPPFFSDAREPCRCGVAILLTASPRRLDGLVFTDQQMTGVCSR